MPSLPVRITQRASRPDTVSAMASRISWSSALRLAGFVMASRATFSAGESSRSLPPAISSGIPGNLVLENDQGIALVHRLALFAEDLLDGPGVLGLDGHLHLHRLEDHHRVALADAVAHFDLDLPDRAGDVGLDFGQANLLRPAGIGCGRQNSRPP